MTKTYKELEAELEARKCHNTRCNGNGYYIETIIDVDTLVDCSDCYGTGIAISKFDVFWKEYTMKTGFTFEVSKSIAKGIFNAGAASKK